MTTAGQPIMAAVLNAPGERLQLEQLSLSGPMADEVRVRVSAAGACHSDYHYMTGDLLSPLPVVLGHEGAGIVEEVGTGVSSVQPGDHVLFLWRAGCGQCEFCAKGQSALCAPAQRIRASGRMKDGTSRLSRDGEEVRHFLGISCFAEELVCAEASVLPIPDSIPLPVAAVASCALVTGVGAVINTAQVEPGASMLVIGLGGVGLSAVMAGATTGASRIVAADVSAAKLDHAVRLGASDVINTSGEDLIKAVRARVPGGVDYAFDAVGRGELLVQALASVRRGGTVVAVGLATSGDRSPIDPLDLVIQEKTLKGCMYGSARPHADFPRLFALYRAGRLPVDQLVTREFALTQVNEAFDTMLSSGAGRAVVIP